MANATVDMGAYDISRSQQIGLTKQVTPTSDVPSQGVVTYTLILSNTGDLTDTVALTDTLPAQVDFGGWVETPAARRLRAKSRGRRNGASTAHSPSPRRSSLDQVIADTATFSGSLQAGSADAAFPSCALSTWIRTPMGAATGL